MANLITQIVKYILIIMIAYCAFSLFFNNRVDTQYFSVVLSDGWATSKDVTTQDGVLTGSFYNKRTKTRVDIHVQPNGIRAELNNLTNSLIDLGNKIVNSEFKQDDEVQAQGYRYVTYKDGDNAGIVLKTQNKNVQVLINVYGPKHADGVDFVNTFFNTDKTLFPKFVDPSVPVNRFNYILWIRTLKTWIHSSLNPAYWF